MGLGSTLACRRPSVQVAVNAPGYLRQQTATDGASVRVDLAPGLTVRALLAELAIPAGEVWRVAVNGTLVPDTYQLCNNDRVMIFPPIGGG